MGYKYSLGELVAFKVAPNCFGTVEDRRHQDGEKQYCVYMQNPMAIQWDRLWRAEDAIFKKLKD